MGGIFIERTHWYEGIKGNNGTGRFTGVRAGYQGRRGNMGNVGTESNYTAQPELKLLFLLTRHSKSWDNSCLPPYPAWVP